MISPKQLARSFKRLPMYAAFGRWRKPCPFEPGYTIALPMPMDMPFLLRLALEGLAAIDTQNCQQILVVPDGWGDDDAAALKTVLDEFDDPRLEIVDLRRIDYRFIRAMRPPGCAKTHWMMVLNAVLYARHEYVFLHDADAFFLEPGGLEKQYNEAHSRGMDVLGVTPRWDPFFTERDITIAGTWELMFSSRWARRRSPMALFPGTWPTAHGPTGFDSTLYAQFLDHHTGKVGVMSQPPSFVHFNGTIYTYRTFRDRHGKSVTDELFRLVLLSVIESALAVDDSQRTTPRIEELALGLTDPAAPVRYDSETNRRGYGEFRTMVHQMCGSPAFVGKRAAVIEQLISPFDRHFGYTSRVESCPALNPGDVRETGLADSAADEMSNPTANDSQN